jgi:hypothetical protein
VTAYLCDVEDDKLVLLHSADCINLPRTDVSGFCKRVADRTKGNLVSVRGARLLYAPDAAARLETASRILTLLRERRA